jgi:hypothetical protein
MNSLIKTLKKVTRWLEKQKVQYMIFGGIANTIYGSPRQTFDIDIKILLESEKEVNAFTDRLGSFAKIIPEKPLHFLKETCVLPVIVNDIRVDFVIANLPYEKEAVKRSQLIETFGISVYVCQPEDLIIQKAVSTRSKDWLDIEALIENQRQLLDWDYIMKHIKELSVFLERPGMHSKIVELKNV